MIGKDPRIVKKIIESDKYQKLVTAIFNLVYDFVANEEHDMKEVESKPEESPNRAYNIPEGTSCLVNRLDKQEIFIARRKVKYSTPCCVCIDDQDREDFFDVLRKNKIKKNKGLYSINKQGDPVLYASYCDLMKRYFKEQL